MIDTLSLFTNNYNILNINKKIFNIIKTKNNNILADTFHGNKAIYKSDYFNIKIDLTGLYINIPSLPFYHYRDKSIITPIDTDDLLFTIFSNLGKDLKNIILKKPEDIFKLYISRIDFYRDIELENPYHLYTDFFKSINGKYFYTKFWSDTVSFSNKSIETIFYDKKNQLKEIYNIDLPTEKEILRTEIKFKKKYIIEKEINITTLGEVSIEKLQNVFTRFLKNRILNYGFLNKEIKKHNQKDYKELEKEILYTGLLSYFNNDLREVKKYYENQGVSPSLPSKKINNIKKYAVKNNTDFQDIKKELEDKLLCTSL